MSGADRLEDGFPHGTTAGYERGCRGGWCPAGNDHGLSCSRAKKLTAGDYRFGRLLKRGLSPAEIAFELGLVPETHEPPKARKVVRDDDTDEVTDLGGDEEPMNEHEKPTVVAKVSKPRTGPTQAEVRAWAHENSIPVNGRGAIRSDVMEAYRAAHAAPEAPADDTAVEAPKPKPPRRKLPPMTPAEHPPALSEPVEHEPAGIVEAVASSEVPNLSLSGVVEAIQVAVVHGAVLPDMETRAELYNEGFADAEEQYSPAIDDMLRAEAALELVLRKWGEERARRQGQSVLLRSMARQVLIAEQERHDDAELLSDMDDALREAQATIEGLRQELAEARATAAAPWWRKAAS